MPAVELVALLGGEPAERRAHVLADGHALPGEEPLERGLAREALDEGPQLAQSRSPVFRRLPHDRRHLGREGRGERGHGSDGAALARLVDQRLRTGEDVQTWQEIALEARPRRATWW